jgi:cell division protein FtsA
VASEELVVGLDIGTTKICAMIADFDENGELEILGVGQSASHGLRRGVVINIESTLRSVSEAIEAAEQMAGREVASVVTGIAGAHIEGINSRGVVAVTGRGREITQQDVDRVLEAAKAVVIPMDREVLHVIPQEFVVDDQGGVKNPLDMIGVRLESEVHIITGSVTSAQNLVKCVNRAGFKVENIILESLASSRAVLTADEKELGVVHIDLGGGTTDVIVYLDGAPYYTSVVPIGGQQVTGDISIVLKTPLESAERIKRQAGCCYIDLVEDNEPVIIPGVGGRPPLTIERKNLCSIIQPRMAEIVTMVRDKIRKKGLLKNLGGGVVLTGGGALMPGAVDLAQEIFGMAARVGRPAGGAGLAEKYRGPEFATVVGLVRMGAEQLEPEAGQPAPKERRGMFESLGKWFRNFFE